MNVLILGRNTINAEIEKVMAGEGINTVTMPDANWITKFKGEPGNFTVTTVAGENSFTSVIITESPQFEGLRAGSGLSINLMDDDETGKLFAASLKANEKIVILLDYSSEPSGGETPEYISAKAINLAQQLAEKKKEVLFLSKTVKSGYIAGFAGDDNERKYKEARNAGVTFVKYEDLTLDYNEETDKFKIEANDGVFNLIIETPYLISLASKETPQLKNISKKLRLYHRPDDSGKFFLYPAFTTRHGIYYLNPALVMPDKELSIKQLIPSIIEDMTVTKNDVYQREIIRGWQFPEVETDKCAFCYSCFRACTHGALEPDIEASAMKIIESECQACGTCMAICPGEAIKRKGSIEPAAQPAAKGKCKIYCCENGAAAAFDETLPFLGEYGKTINCERVACGGSISTDRLALDFRDYETIIVACCIEGSCRHIDGDKRACKQVLRTAELLKKAGLENRRIEVIKVSGFMSNVMKDNILCLLGGQI